MASAWEKAGLEPQVFPSRDGKLPSDLMLSGSQEKGLWFVKSVGKGNMKLQEGRGDRQRDEPMPSAALRTEFS